MKKAYIKKPVLPFSLRLIRGAIGKKFVIKHYKYGIVKTKYPDMTKIIASIKQRKCRDGFKEAVAYAKQVISDDALKKAWQKKIKRRNGVFNSAIKFYMLKNKRDKERMDLLIARMIRLAFKNATAVPKTDTIPAVTSKQNEQLPAGNVFIETG